MQLQLTTLAVLALAPAALAQTTDLLSHTLASTAGNGSSLHAEVSADGRWVVFQSSSNDMVGGDGNAVADIYLADRQTGQISIVSVSSSAPVAANGQSTQPAISADGRYVAFNSVASNLVVGATGSSVYLRDLLSATTTRVSLGSSGFPANNANSYPALSNDGRYLIWWSQGANMVQGWIPTNGEIYRRDLVAGVTELASAKNAGGQGALGVSPHVAGISGDGRYVIFLSNSTDIVPNDTNGATDAFLHDFLAGSTIRVDVTSLNQQANGAVTNVSISADGRYVAFDSSANNLVSPDANGQSDVFVRDLLTGLTSCASVTTAGLPGNGASTDPDLSADGRYVCFRSSATNLVLGDSNLQPDIYVRDLVTGTTVRASLTSIGTQGSGPSSEPVISADGRMVAYTSDANDLVIGDGNNQPDILASDFGCAAAWCDLGNGLAGIKAQPQLAVLGSASAATSSQFKVTNGPALSFGALVLGASQLNLPIFGGVLVPKKDLLISFLTNALGANSVPIAWPPAMPPGIPIFAQAWLLDAAAVQGLSATNAMGTTTL